MSPRAAWRLESLGFEEVYDYVAGKADWFASGLPREGAEAAIPRAGDAARTDVPTCELTETAGAAEARMNRTGWDQCLVVNAERVVLGRLRLGRATAEPATVVEEVMEAGPTTVRPDEQLAELTARLQKRGVQSVLVTTSDGRLVGILLREDAEPRLGTG